MKKDYIFTSESVTEGHPDKLCDQISDAVVDHFLQQDPYAFIETECALAQSIVFVAAQFASTATVDIPYVAREVIGQVGYNEEPFSGKKCTILTSFRESALDERYRFREMEMSDQELSQIKVRNQVNAFGFACDQTPAFMPMAIWLAHKLARRLTAVRFTTVLPELAPDGKTQVAVEYQDGRPARIHGISLHVCCRAAALTSTRDSKKMQEEIREKVIIPSFYGESLAPDDKTRIYIALQDASQGCGPIVHSGLTGRKTAIDTYGEYARHSGAALSGKAPRRIDRIGTYAARYAAKNIVAAGLADECELQVSYSVGLSQPVSIYVETFGTGKIPGKEIYRLVNEHFDFRPAAIMKQFKLRHLPRTIKGGFYKKLAAYGQVGRMDIGLPWEVTDKVAALKAAIGG